MTISGPSRAGSPSWPADADPIADFFVARVVPAHAWIVRSCATAPRTGCIFLGFIEESDGLFDAIAVTRDAGWSAFLTFDEALAAFERDPADHLVVNPCTTVRHAIGIHPD